MATVKREVVILPVTKESWARIVGDFLPKRKRFPYTRRELEEYVRDNIGGPGFLCLTAWEGQRPPEVVGVACVEEIPLPPGLLISFFSCEYKEAVYKLLKYIYQYGKQRGFDDVYYVTHRNPKATVRITGGKVKGSIIQIPIEEGLRVTEEKLSKMEEKE